MIYLYIIIIYFYSGFDRIVLKKNQVKIQDEENPLERNLRTRVFAITYSLSHRAPGVFIFCFQSFARAHDKNGAFRGTSVADRGYTEDLHIF
jgi:hypothetical protein